MDIIERVARAIAGANMDERINLYEDDAKAAIAALADGELDEKGRDAMRKIRLNISSTRRSGENGLRNDDELIRAYLIAIKETPNG